MNKLIVIGIFLFYSSSFAASLVDSKQSVTSSDFCKRYSCKLTYSGPIEGNGNSKEGYREFIYSVSNLVSIDVFRRPDNEIESTSLDFNGSDGFLYAFRNDGGQYIDDFSLSFVGFKPQSGINSACLSSINRGDSPYSYGLMGSNSKYAITCSGTVAQKNEMPARTHAGIVVGHW